MLLCDRCQEQSVKTLELPRENLADLAGMATETVSRVLSDFKDEGLIDRKAGRITVLEPLNSSVSKIEGFRFILY